MTSEHEAHKTQWYGMAADDAADRCKARGLPCRFTVTMDPKASAAMVGDIPKVIRAKEVDGVMIFLVGYFAPPKRSLNNEGERVDHV